MPRLTIDNQSVEVPAGATILDAARKLGLDIPTLCHLEGCKPNASCMVCLVKVGPNGRLLPSCAALAEEGMVIESETPGVHEARKSALEMLLSDHAGDCLAPCQRICPAHMDIPQMMRQIAAGRMDQAIATVKAEIALPAVLGRICPAPCEKGCRRISAGGALSVCVLKRHAADVDLASQQPFLPGCAPPTGQRVAVVGAGPAGLAAAYHLVQLGHAVAVFDDHELPGGALRYVPENVLPRAVLDGEIAVIRRLGVAFRMSVRLGGGVTLPDLRRDFQAVLLTVGPVRQEQEPELGVRLAGKGVAVDQHTWSTNEAGVFAAGAAVRPSRLSVRSLAEGKAAAASIHQYLSGQRLQAPERPWTISLGQLHPAEIAQLMTLASPEARHERSAVEEVLDAASFRAEAQRCLHCDCRKVSSCKLREYAQRYGANPARFDGTRPNVELRVTGKDGRVVFEPGKCIDCGLCVQIAAAAGEPLGVAFIGRGFAMRPGTPFGTSFDQALGRSAEAVIRACPTGALAWRDEL